jgi:hypothetical protein
MKNIEDESEGCFGMGGQVMAEKSVLVYRLGSLGDTLIALPVFHFLRKKFPEIHIVALTNRPVESKAPAMASVLEHTGLDLSPESPPKMQPLQSSLEEGGGRFLNWRGMRSGCSKNKNCEKSVVGWMKEGAQVKTNMRAD